MLAGLVVQAAARSLTVAVPKRRWLVVQGLREARSLTVAALKARWLVQAEARSLTVAALKKMGAALMLLASLYQSECSTQILRDTPDAGNRSGPRPWRRL